MNYQTTVPTRAKGSSKSAIKGTVRILSQQEELPLLRDHLLRLDDEVTCKSCGKKFEVPSLHSLLFTDQLDGLPKDEDAESTEDTPPAAPIDRAKLPARFTRPTKGWRG